VNETSVSSQERQVGRATAFGVVRAEPPRREERTFEMRADDARAALVRGHSSQRGGNLDLGGGDERGLERGDPGSEQRFAGAHVVVEVRDLEVDAGEAVDLEIDESRRRDQTRDGHRV
jgi:hypothetical protein